MRTIIMGYVLDWTFPNLGKYYQNNIPIRGTFDERFWDAKKLGLTRIEIPFDLVRRENKENLKLNKKVGEIITKDDFQKLYGVRKFRCEYILHTDPELKPSHILYWNQRNWRRKYLESIVDFSEFVEIPPFAVEFHPSKPVRSKGYIIHLIV